MENYSRWLPTREATAYLGVSSQFLKKNRDIKNGFLIEEKHYILGANINSSILWNVSEILKEFHYRGSQRTLGLGAVLGFGQNSTR